MGFLSGSLFNILITLLFVYEGTMMIIRKKGGSSPRADRNYEKYTPESVRKFSIIGGLLFYLIALSEIFIILLKMNVISIPSLMNEDGGVSFWAGLVPVVVIVIIFYIVYFVVLKKRDDYVEPTKQDKKQDDEEDY